MHSLGADDMLGIRRLLNYSRHPLYRIRAISNFHYVQIFIWINKKWLLGG